VCELSYPSSQLGSQPKQGKRKDLDELVEMAKTNKSRKAMIDANPTGVMRYYKGLEYIRSQFEPSRNFQTEAIVYWGPTGSGKTYHVNHLCEGREVFYLTKAMASSNQVWWDGYNGQDTVVIEEFYGWIPVNVLLNIINTAPFTVPIKGGSRSFQAKRVYITSNAPPDSWYKDLPPAVAAAFKRRFMAPVGHVFFVGYGDDYSQEFCDCAIDDRASCFRQHVEPVGQSASCFATGFSRSSS